MTIENTQNDTTSDAADAGTTTALGDAAAADTNAEATEGDDENVVDKSDDVAADKADETGDKAKDDDAKADADKAEAPTGAPDAYDTEAWEMPEGVEFDREGFEAVEPVLRDLDLTNDQAGKLMGAYAEKIVPMIEQRAAKQMDDAAKELSANLARDLQADPEVGGAKLKEAQAFSAKAIAAAIPDAAQRSEFSKFLNESGLGNHPLLTRVLNTAGRAMSEASTPSGDAGGGEKTAAEVFYGRK